MGSQAVGAVPGSGSQYRGEVRKMIISKNIEITVIFRKTEGRALKEILEEIWDLEKEHPDIKINVKVLR